MTAKPRQTPRKPPRIRNRADYEALTEPSKDARYRALQAVGYMRNQHLPISQAAALAGTTPATIRRYASEALQPGVARAAARPSDRLYRRMSVLSADGPRSVDVTGSRDASLIGSHHNAVRRYLETGDEDLLDPFQGRVIDGVELLADIDRIEELAAQRELDIDDIYPRT